MSESKEGMEVQRRKVFISFLGNSKYEKATYINLDGKVAEPSNFIQEVLFDYFCKEWSEKDQIYIICTDGAKGSYYTNWKHVSQNETGFDNFSKEDQKILINNKEKFNYQPLSEILKDKVYSSIVTPIRLEENAGNNMWNVFDSIYEQIREGDILYLDVTNAFRTFPTLATTLLQYAKFMKKAQIEGLYYGLFNREEQYQSIQDMTPIIQLQECVDMANGLVKYGRLNVLAKELEKYNLLEKTGNSLDELDKALSANIGKILRKGDFKSEIDKAQKKNWIEHSNLPSPGKRILRETFNLLSNFKINGDLNNFLEAARWAFKYRMLPQAYTMGKEFINRSVANKLMNKNPYTSTVSKNNDARTNYIKYINIIISIEEKYVNNRNYTGDLRTFLNTTEYLIQLEWIKELRSHYIKFNSIRNALMHAKNEFNFEYMESYFEDHFETCVKIVEEAPIETKVDEPESLSPVFINLTNHPSSSWNVEQLKKAQEFGEIIDIPFPIIDETQNESFIDNLVSDYVSKIMDITLNMKRKTTVHVMGEMTFTYSIVERLKKLRCTCVASTTKRIVEDLPDGTKKATFAFARFREYK